jgi:uncharacterized membrane protein YccC
MKRKPINKKAFARAGWSALSRMIGISLGTVAGSVIAHSLGSRLDNALWLAVVLLVLGFLAMLFAEYEKNIHN